MIQEWEEIYDVRRGSQGFKIQEKEEIYDLGFTIYEEAQEIQDSRFMIQERRGFKIYEVGFKNGGRFKIYDLREHHTR
jgi:hypothetical protein